MDEPSGIRIKCPYPGPRPFKRGDENWFRGRRRETSDLYHLVAAQRVVLLYAQSGAGKTSLVTAGLRPRFEREGVPVKILRVGLAPLHRVRMQSIPNMFVYCASHSNVPEVDWPSNARLSNLVHDGAGNTVLVFDQFEEIFTRFPERWSDREGFFRQAAELLDASPQVCVLFVLREEYLAETDVYGALLPGGYRVRYHLERLRANEALEAIVEPALSVGCRFDTNVAEKLVKDLQRARFQTVRGLEEVPGEYVEPVHLQVVCTELWKALPPDTTVITAEHVKTHGDASRALAAYYEDAVRTAIDTGKVSEDRLRHWFDQKLITAAGTRGMVYRDKRTTEGVSNDVVDLLEEQHIIRAEPRGVDRWYELTHDRFIEPIQNANRKWRDTQTFHSQLAVWLGGPAVAVVLIIVALGLLSSLVVFWPSALGNHNTVRMLGWPIAVDPEVRLILLVAIPAALGSYVQVVSSLVQHIVNRSFSTSWVLWYFLRMPLGMTVAIILYFAFRAGFLAGRPAYGELNVFGITALAGLVALFSRPIVDKLREFFDDLFLTAPGFGDDARRDKMNAAPPIVLEISPARLPSGGDDMRVIVRGARFIDGSAVTVNDQARPTVFVDSYELYGYLGSNDLARPGKLLVAVELPPPVSTRSNTTTLDVLPGES